jgi:hypothetical protein
VDSAGGMFPPAHVILVSSGETIMPMKSKAQNRFMHATAEGKTDVSPKVGKKFIKEQHGKSEKNLPEKVKRRK